MSVKLDRLRAELDKARRKKTEWEGRVRDLERRFREEENAEIHDMVHAANLNPDQLAELLAMFAANPTPQPAVLHTIAEEETADED